MSTLLPEDRSIWAMFYATIVGMERHPGNKANNTHGEFHQLSIAAALADDMLYHYKRRLAWQSSQPSSQAEQPSQET